MGRKRKGKVRSKIIIGIIIVCILLLCIPNVYYLPYLMNNGKVEADYGTSDDLTIMSYNIRCWTPLDIGKRSWFYRADLILENIRAVKPVIIGFQEVTSLQYNYLHNKLEGFQSIIEYRDKVPWSEGCPIFYNQYMYELVESGTFWLSETPNKISKGWGAADYRICSYVILVDKSDNSKIAVFNTHLDHESEEARIRGVQVIQGMIEKMEGIPIILMGDLNAIEMSDTYEYITESFVDTRYAAEESNKGSTYQDWGKEMDRPAIDYIMVSPDDFTVSQFYIWEQIYKGTYPSDHFPVCVKLKKSN